MIRLFGRRHGDLNNSRRPGIPRIEALEERATPSATLTTVHTFPLSTSLANGYVSQIGPLAVDSKGDIFGATTISNGAQTVGGTFFEVPKGSQTVNSVGTFGATSLGGGPSSLIVDGSGNLYGTTSDGAVFSLPAGSQTPQILTTFGLQDTGFDLNGLVLVGGVLYGSAEEGGPLGHGTLFSVSVGGGTPSVAAFDGTDGDFPVGGLIASGGDIYGTTQSGGTSGKGTVFSWPLAGGSITALASFDGTQGVMPDGNLIVNGGYLIGMLSDFNTTGYGHVFRVPLAGGSVYGVPLNGVDALAPKTGLVVDGSTIVGTSYSGGAEHGNVFKVDPTTLAVSDLVDFHGSDGSGPFAILGVDDAGNVYGVAYATDANTSVIVFQVSGISGGGGGSPPASGPPGEVKLMSVEESATLANTIEVDYQVTGGGVGQPFEITVYRARKDRFSEDRKAGDRITLGTQLMTGDNLTAGSHSVNFSVPAGSLGIDGFHPYILAVADPNHTNRKVNKFLDEESFEIRTIGIVSEGFTLGVPFFYKSPAWVTKMANTLKKKDDFTTTIPFAWASSTPGRTADYAGTQLYAELAPIIQNWTARYPGDVINFDFIAHSRGAVVISRAVEALYQNAQSLGLSHEYVKMTFLDPHPASLVYGDNAGYATSGPKAIAAAPILAGYEAFELASDDGPVNVPLGVDEVEDFYEETSSADLTGAESLLDLHGLSPSDIHNFYDAPIAEVIDLTNRHVNPRNRHSPLIGHGEVTDWFQDNAVDTGKVGTGKQIAH